MNLSPHFTLEEFTRSQTAVRRGIDNTPPPEVIESLTLLCVYVLEPIRAALGPVSISSGYRSVTLNRAIGGASGSRSQHTKGEAADISVEGMDTEALYTAIKSSPVPFDQLIQEFGQWVHISYSANTRRQCLRAVKEGGKTVYLPD